MNGCFGKNGLRRNRKILGYWDIGILEYWDIGILGYWDIGILGYWDIKTPYKLVFIRGFRYLY
jgi:hypothetical protein